MAGQTAGPGPCGTAFARLLPNLEPRPKVYLHLPPAQYTVLTVPRGKTPSGRTHRSLRDSTTIYRAENARVNVCVLCNDLPLLFHCRHPRIVMSGRDNATGFNTPPQLGTDNNKYRRFMRGCLAHGGRGPQGLLASHKSRRMPLVMRWLGGLSFVQPFHWLRTALERERASALSQAISSGHIYSEMQKYFLNVKFC